MHKGKRRPAVRTELSLDVELLGQKLPGDPQERLKLLGGLENILKEQGEEWVRRNKQFILIWALHALDVWTRKQTSTIQKRLSG